MEIDQIIFKKVISFFHRRLNKVSDEEKLRTVELSDVSGKLTYIARALTGLNIDIVEAEEEGGWKGELFYLPKKISFFDDVEKNVMFYVFRTVYLSQQLELNINWLDKDDFQSIEDSRLKAKESSQVILEALGSEYPSIHKFYEGIQVEFTELELEHHWLFGKLMINEVIIRDKKKSMDSKGDTHSETAEITTEIKSKAVEEAKVIEVNKKAQEDYTLAHYFEKVETAEEFKGVWRDFDGDDDLEKDSDALQELNLKHMVRSDEATHSVYQADFRDLQNISNSAENDEKGYYKTYKEWNFKKSEYKADFCKVYLKLPEHGNLDYAQKCINENALTLSSLRRKFAQINQVRRQVNKLSDGEEYDLDSIVDMFTDIKSGHTPSENIYLSKRKKEADISILFLIDLSMSTDSYAAGNRVLDVEKQAVILFGEVLEEYGIDFAVGGFSSKTRNNCSYYILKDFDTDWNTGKKRIGEASPEGYTRIGPALRHAKSLIEDRKTQNKWVVLISDGKPNDYDKYEGKYGVHDVKKALDEMHEYHINTYAIAIESVARFYLPQMFGQNHYNILSHPDMMLNSLTTFYKRIQNL